MNGGILNDLMDEITRLRRQFITEHDGQAPTRVFLPREIANPLAALGHEQLGVLAADIMGHGIDVLEQTGLLDLQVTLTDEEDIRLA